MARSSFVVAGARNSGEEHTWVPKLDKNPFYRTTDILNGIFKKSIRLEKGGANKTDCKGTIWVRFGGNAVPTPVIEDLGTQDDRRTYRLECGHIWKGKSDFPIGKRLPCDECGAAQAYLGMEHEWQHIIFKTNPVAEEAFISAWIPELQKQAPWVDASALRMFLHLMINAFDDIRCNSLWEKVYPGSAHKIWQRWKRLSESAADSSQNFLAFMFAVALGIPTDPQGPYESLRPVLEWGMQNIRYKGFGNALIIARTCLDRCMGILLQPPPPPPQSQAPNQQPQQGQQDDDQDSQQDGSGDGGQEGEPVQLPDSPSAQTSGASPQDQTQALNTLMGQSSAVDEQEEHYQATDTDIANDPASRSTQAIVAAAMNVDPSADDIDNKINAGQLDQDVARAIDQILNTIGQKSPDSQLTSDAKAAIQFIDVKPSNIDPSSKVELSEEEESAVQRLRAIFFRTFGKLKARRSSMGAEVDVQAAIQHMLHPDDGEIFQVDMSNQGFAYLILTDMSGSMSGRRFDQVCRATEMLKKALSFPFVEGKLWGFRGGYTDGRAYRSGEVWLYRYDKDCEGYLGKAGKYPVECDGITPMNSAIRVASKHMLTQVSPGMAKRVFLLTDGAPCQTRTTGSSLPDWMLRQFVEKEIRWARQKGIEVSVLLIDSSGLDDKQACQMFGPSRFWKRVSSNPNSPDSVDKALTQLVLSSFSKYIKSRG